MTTQRFLPWLVGAITSLLLLALPAAINAIRDLEHDVTVLETEVRVTAARFTDIEDRIEENRKEIASLRLRIDQLAKLQMPSKAGG